MQIQNIFMTDTPSQINEKTDKSVLGGGGSCNVKAGVNSGLDSRVYRSPIQDDAAGNTVGRSTRSSLHSGFARARQIDSKGVYPPGRRHPHRAFRRGNPRMVDCPSKERHHPLLPLQFEVTLVTPPGPMVESGNWWRNGPMRQGFGFPSTIPCHNPPIISYNSFTTPN